ncbi:OadG family protein [Natranaerobius trueperi]|uniref:Uncharacterized protein n=1 Tax=Natranaerobius trueperi TaxID=759412 RepID=A0A226BY20_9FIRM|nr:OadG family protein [Natranaerobius trueperi]OWZ83099.1 hypothetical protein CDO51_10385 [Natranaerobius trueperi]
MGIDMETLNQGLQVTFLGFSVVLIALFMLFLIMILFGKIFNPESKKQEPQIEQQETKSSEQKQEIDEQESEPSPQVVAAISAAISLALGDKDSSFRITSIRPINRPVNSSWKFMSKKAQMEATPNNKK